MTAVMTPMPVSIATMMSFDRTTTRATLMASQTAISTGCSSIQRGIDDFI